MLLRKLVSRRIDRYRGDYDHVPQSHGHVTIVRRHVFQACAERMLNFTQAYEHSTDRLILVY